MVRCLLFFTSTTHTPWHGPPSRREYLRLTLFLEHVLNNTSDLNGNILQRVYLNNCLVSNIFHFMVLTHVAKTLSKLLIISNTFLFFCVLFLGQRMPTSLPSIESNLIIFLFQIQLRYTILLLYHYIFLLFFISEIQPIDVMRIFCYCLLYQS